MTLNHDAAIVRDPFKKAVCFLSFMKGAKTKGWMCQQYAWLQKVEDDPMMLSLTKNVWQIIQHNFQQAFIDYAIKEKAQDELHKLKMKEGNINQYIVDFQLTAMNTQVDVDEPTVLKIFYHRLPLALADRCIDQESPSNFTSWAKVAQRQQ